MNAPQASVRRRRQAAPTQAAIARAARAAQALGPQWQVVVEGDSVRLFQGPPPKADRSQDLTPTVRDFTL